MKKFIARKLAYMVLIFLGISILIFILGHLAPGDPAELALSRDGAFQPTEEQIEATREKLGLSGPLYVQYFSWLKKIIRLDFGTSYSTSRQVGEIFAEKLPYTLKLSIFSIIIIVLFGLIFGILAAVSYNSLLDYFIQGLQNIFLSLPQFWIGIFLILVFNERLKILPSSGVGSFKHYILPSLTLSLIGLSNISRLTRAAFLNELGKAYYNYGIARSISKKRIVFTHVFPNAFLSVLPLIGNYVAGLIGGSSIVETIFAIPGIGAFAVNSILLKDIPVLQAYVLFTSAVFLISYTLVDLISISLNPRLKGELTNERNL